MSLLIDAPEVEGRLRQEAAKRGLSPSDYAAEILTTHLVPNSLTDPDLAFHTIATLTDWEKAFDEWIDGHSVRNPLPNSATQRESI